MRPWALKSLSIVLSSWVRLCGAPPFSVGWWAVGLWTIMGGAFVGLLVSAMVATSGYVSMVWKDAVVKLASLYSERDVLYCLDLWYGPWGITGVVPSLRLFLS